jgi:hypothetical protein
MARENPHLERARELMKTARLDPVKLEERRKRTLLALLVANDIHIPNAEKLDSKALRQILDAATEDWFRQYQNGR